MSRRQAGTSGSKGERRSVFDRLGAKSSPKHTGEDETNVRGSEADGAQDEVESENFNDNCAGVDYEQYEDDGEGEEDAEGYEGEDEGGYDEEEGDYDESENWEYTEHWSLQENPDRVGQFSEYRGKGLKRHAVQNFDDHDTDSVASSASSVHPNEPVAKKRAAGSHVSPLNRRRSVRLAEKRNQQAMNKQVTECFDFLSLSTQNTVVMKPLLEKMETTRRWNRYRGDTRPRLKADDTLRVPGLMKQDTATLNNDSQPIASTSTAPVCRRQTTTAALREQLARVGLDGMQPHAADEVDAGLLASTSAVSPRLKRKASNTTPLSPTISMPAKRLAKKGLQKKVTIVEHDETQQAFPQLKRRATRRVESQDLEISHKNKKPRLGRKQTTIIGNGGVYIPPREGWPLTVKAQIVWTVPLKDQNHGDKHSLAVYVDHSRCLLGDEDGEVLELDQRVLPVNKYVLPSGVKGVLPYSDYLLAGCNDGAIYDLSNGEAKVLTTIQGFGQVFRMSAYRDNFAVSDQHGHIAMIDNTGQLVWRRKSAGEFGWMVSMDDTGVYHGHSKGVTKYSILDGSTLWHTDTAHSVLDGAQTSDSLFATCGAEVLQLDKMTGQLQMSYVTKGKLSAGIIHCCAVGCGIVFTAGTKLLCYEQSSGDLVYQMKLPMKLHSLQYFSGRLFCVGPGRLSVLDFTKPTITQAMAGEDLETMEVSADPTAPTHTPLRKVPSLRSTAGGSVRGTRPLRARRGLLKARALSKRS